VTKKRKKNNQAAPETGSETRNRKRGKPSTRWGGGSSFFWGLSLGFLVTLGLTISGDLGLNLLPAQLTESKADAGILSGSSMKGTSLFLSGALPRGAHVYVDGQPATAIETVETGVRVMVAPDAQKLEVRGVEGIWWSTRLSEDSGDTLRPVLGGEIVIEVQKGGAAGDLYVDGVRVGEAPGSVGEVDPGWHVISIRAGESTLFEDACEVVTGELSVITVPPIAPRGKGRVTIRARQLGDNGFEEREGNPVFVDGQPMGHTPLSLTLAAGFHSVRVGSRAAVSLVEVINLEAGTSRYVNAEFGREERLTVQVVPPQRAGADTPLAIPVHIRATDESVLLEEGFIHIVKAGQARAVGVPLVPSGTDPDVWVAVVPRELSAGSQVLVGYASCLDDLGRRGESELFQLPLH
jgi:hypothetical protein